MTLSTLEQSVSSINQTAQNITVESICEYIKDTKEQISHTDSKIDELTGSDDPSDIQLITLACAVRYRARLVKDIAWITKVLETKVLRIASDCLGSNSVPSSDYAKASDRYAVNTSSNEYYITPEQIREDIYPL